MARNTKDVWRNRVQRWRDSDLTAQEYADEIGVNVHTLKDWSWKLSRENPPVVEPPPVQQDQHPLAFVELALTPATRTPSVPMELAVNARHTVRLEPCFDGAALGRLLDVIEARS